MRFEIILVRTFTDIVYAIVLAIVIHNRRPSTLIVNAKPFTYRTCKPIPDVVLSKIIAIVAQDKALKLIQIRIIREQFIIQPLIAIFFAECYRNGLFILGTAVISKNLESGRFCKRRRTRSRLHQLHRHRDLLIKPVICPIIGDNTVRKISPLINSRIWIKKGIRICSQKYGRDRRRIFKDIGTDKFFTAKGPRRKRSATDCHRRIDLYR